MLLLYSRLIGVCRIVWINLVGGSVCVLMLSVVCIVGDSGIVFVVCGYMLLFVEIIDVL